MPRVHIGASRCGRMPPVSTPDGTPESPAVPVMRRGLRQGSASRARGSASCPLPRPRPAGGRACSGRSKMASSARRVLEACVGRCRIGLPASGASVARRENRRTPGRPGLDRGRLPLDGEFNSAEAFVDIEQLANRVGRSLARQLAQRALHRQADAEPAETPCPQCARTCRLTRHKRLLTTVAGEVAYSEPASHCPACRRDFFPGRPKLRLGERSYSPDLLRRLAERTPASKSFEQAATAKC